MSLMIQGMEMPKRCYDCELFSGEGYLCPLVETTDNWQEIMYKRVADCPLSAIQTPHGDLIDRDELVSKLIPVKDAQSGIGQTFMEWLIALIKEKPPTIIEAEE